MNPRAERPSLPEVSSTNVMWAGLGEGHGGCYCGRHCFRGCIRDFIGVVTLNVVVASRVHHGDINPHIDISLHR